ncbi:uncharacterized protein LOC112486961 [Cynoglossus semilaevis]|uniref:uncharacterized protein LOC112486961 n=1 Tax=Cynoglossus semilaevis TaxID=244447 RepID=UPI000D622FD1|nr:uncharacterized protein LOC112486961 [Cynoglossus semilaevis]
MILCAEDHLQNNAPSLSDHDLSKLITISPLFKTLQDIQQSLQTLSTARSTQHVHTVYSAQKIHDGQLIPTALDSLSPHHAAVFLFGCQVMQLLENCSLFPSVLLLLAKSIPVSSSACNEAMLAHCSGDFYFDETNQILYLSEAKLQHVGHFIAIILQSMAHIASGSKPQAFMHALHEAVSALGLASFNLSFHLNAAKSPTNPAGGLVRDFLNLRLPCEARFTEHLLAHRLVRNVISDSVVQNDPFILNYKNICFSINRLEKYKYFKMEQLITRPSDKNTVTGPTPRGTPMKISCIEEEMDHLNESFLQLSMQLQSRAQASRWENERETSAEKHSESSLPLDVPSLSRDGTVLLELKRQYVTQRLHELQTTLGLINHSGPLDGSKSNDWTSCKQTDNSVTAQHVQMDSYSDMNDCSPPNAQQEDGIPANRSQSQETEQQIESVLINSPETLLNGQTPGCQDEISGSENYHMAPLPYT